MKTLMMIPLVLAVSSSVWAEDYIVYGKAQGGTAVFSDSEKVYLIKEGLGDIASAQKIKSSRKPMLRVRVEKNASVSLFGDPLENEQWGLRNTGMSFPLDIDDITSLPIPGVAGEDLGIDRIAPLRPVREIIVAVLDTGIDLMHPDLSDRIAIHPGECRALAEFEQCLKTENQRSCERRYATLDTDGNGYPLDCYGWNLTGKVNSVTRIMGDSNTQDKAGHGTHVAGIIAASANGIGVRGVAPTVKILPVKVLQGAPGGQVRTSADTDAPLPQESALTPITTYADIFARGLLYAIRSGANVINMSLGWTRPVDSELMRRLVQLAEKKGIILVAAAGNDSTYATVMPCLYDGVICVGAHNPDGSAAIFSNYGTSVDLLAPGHKILSTWPMSMRPDIYERNGYEFYNGTSMASPFVAGMSAAMLERGIPSSEIYPRLMLGARPSRSSLVPELRYMEKYALAGNADLAGAIDVAAQAFIAPVQKEGIRVMWNGHDTLVPVTLTLKNFWSRAQNVEISLAPSRSNGPSISPNAWTESSWSLGDVRVLKGMIHIDDPRMASEHRMQLTIVADGHPTTFPMDLQIEVPLESIRDMSVSMSIDRHGIALPEGTSFRTITSHSDSSRSVLVVSPEGAKQRYRLLNLSGGPSGLSDGVLAEKVNGELLSIDRFDNAIVLSYRVRAASFDVSPTMEFHYYSLDLNAPPVIKRFSNEMAIINESMGWMLQDHMRVPIWAGMGYRPSSEQGPIDPWQKPSSEGESPYPRVYFLDRGEELRTVALPTDMVPVQLLAPSQSEDALGIVPIVVAKGQGYNLEFYFGRIQRGVFTLGQKLIMPQYQMIGGVTPSDVSMWGLGNEAASFFSTDGGGGRARLSILRYQPGLPGANVEQATLAPLGPLAKLHRVAGVVITPTRSGAFTQSKYELQYHDLKTRDVATTSLKRFSFMPGAYFDRFFYPMAISDGGELIPSLLIPTGLGTSNSVEIVRPRWENGRMVGLERPAKFRIIPSPGCVEMNPHVEATESRLVFLCGDTLTEVPLTY